MAFDFGLSELNSEDIFLKRSVVAVSPSLGKLLAFLNWTTIQTKISAPNIEENMLVKDTFSSGNVEIGKFIEKLENGDVFGIKKLKPNNPKNTIISIFNALIQKLFSSAI